MGIDDAFVDGACANLLHAGLGVDALSTSEITRCLVDVMKQADAELEDPEEVLLGAARLARLRELELKQHMRIAGGGMHMAAAALVATGAARPPQASEDDERAQAFTGAHSGRAGLSVRSASSAGSDGGSADQPGHGELSGAIGGGAGARAGGAAARSAAPAAAAAPPAASVSIQDCVVFYVSVASLAAFFTRSICSYVVAWWCALRRCCGPRAARPRRRTCARAPTFAPACCSHAARTRAARAQADL